MTYQPSPSEFAHSLPWAALAFGALDAGAWREQAALVLTNPTSHAVVPPWLRGRFETLAFSPTALLSRTDLSDLRGAIERIVDLEVAA